MAFTLDGKESSIVATSKRKIRMCGLQLFQTVRTYGACHGIDKASVNHRIACLLMNQVQ